MNERAACRGTPDDLTAAWCIDPRLEEGVLLVMTVVFQMTLVEMDMMMRKGWAVAVVGEEWDGKGCCSDGNPIDDAARVDGSDGVTKMIMFFVCVCDCMPWELKVVVILKDKRTMMWTMMMVNMNPWYVCVFQEVTLSSQPSVGRLILAVLRDITGWLIAVATSLQSQSSAATMWPRRGRWVGVGHARARWQQHTWTHQVHTEVW